MPAQESLSNYQLGKYLFTKEHIDADGNFGIAPQTQYKMYRDPSAEEWAEEPDYAPARDVGTLTVSHLPPEELAPQLTRRVTTNRPGMRRRPEVFQQKLRGAEGPGRIVASQAWHERYSPKDVVHLLTVGERSKAMTPTLLALGQRQAKETTGQALQASTDLSAHSQRLVDRFKEAGLVSASHETEHRNQITFLPELPVGPAGGLEGFFSTVQGLHERKRRILANRQRMGYSHDTMPEVETPIPLADVQRAKAEGREMIRSLRPRAPKTDVAPPRRSREEQSGHVPRSVRDA